MEGLNKHIAIATFVVTALLPALGAAQSPSARKAAAPRLRLDVPALLTTPARKASPFGVEPAGPPAFDVPEPLQALGEHLPLWLVPRLLNTKIEVASSVGRIDIAPRIGLHGIAITATHELSR